MPVGIIINALSVASGGVVGALFGHKLPTKDQFRAHEDLRRLLHGNGRELHRTHEKYARRYLCGDHWDRVWAGGESRRDHQQWRGVHGEAGRKDLPE